MKSVTGIYEGEIHELEESKNTNERPKTVLYLLSDRQIIKILVRNNELFNKLKSVPLRSHVKVKAVARFSRKIFFSMQSK